MKNQPIPSLFGLRIGTRRSFNPNQTRGSCPVCWEHVKRELLLDQWTDVIGVCENLWQKPVRHVLKAVVHHKANVRLKPPVGLWSGQVALLLLRYFPPDMPRPRRCNCTDLGVFFGRIWTPELAKRCCFRFPFKKHQNTPTRSRIFIIVPVGCIGKLSLLALFWPGGLSKWEMLDLCGQIEATLRFGQFATSPMKTSFIGIPSDYFRLVNEVLVEKDKSFCNPTQLNSGYPFSSNHRSGQLPDSMGPSLRNSS